jgi:uncharacterized protein (TIGR03083 family)
LIRTAHLFEELDGLLLDLLESLTPGEWDRPTVSPRWNVKQVAAHLLDTPLRRLSFVRDGCRPAAPPIRSDADLAAFVNEMNRQGVEVLARLSPRLLITFMEVATRELREYFATLDPEAPAAFSVSWAGERRSQNWFDVARELTERWHHQQQIREAVGKPGIMIRRLYHPVLETFLRALPHAYRDVRAPEATVVEIVVVGECGGAWRLERTGHGWLASREADLDPAATIAIPQEIAWKVFTKGMTPAEAAARSTIAGEADLALPALSMTAIVA